MALTLRMLGGLSTPEIARAFLVGESTVAQRIVRAKKALAGVAFAAPDPDELGARLAGVLEVVYLIFNEGYSATAGDDWMRPELCEDALRLGRVLSTLAPRESEVWGLLALMEIQASRIGARVARDGTPILLADQDRSRWDRLLIQRGLAALRRAEGLGLGVYGVQAAIAACHARAARLEDTDWIRIAALYDTLAGISPSPVVELNRAVAIGMAFGPHAGLCHLDQHVARARRLPPAPERARRPAGAPRPPRGGARRVRARRRADRQRRRAGAPTGPGRGARVRSSRAASRPSRR